MTMLARLASSVVVLAVAAGAACTRTPTDIGYLRDTADDGPERLAGVIVGPGSSASARREAVVALVTLTRRDRHVGLDVLADTLSKRSAAERAAWLEGVGAELAKGMALTRSATEDPALAYKDGAYLVYSRQLVAGTERETLSTALEGWVRESPMDRLEDQRQRYDSRSLLHALGPAATRSLARFFDDEHDYPRALRLVLAEGDDEAKHAAALSLARLIVPIRSAAAADSKQASALGRLLRALAQLELPEATRALVAAAEDHAIGTRERIAALESLGRHPASLEGPQIESLFALTTDADGELAQAAFALLAQAPRGRSRLLALVESTRSWRVRMAAASALMHGASRAGVDEALGDLPPRDRVSMARAEIDAYAAVLGASPEGLAAARAHLGSTSLGARLTALTTLRDDRPLLAAYEKDRASLPRCSTRDECDWTCGGKRVTTVGQYVRECLAAPSSEQARAHTPTSSSSVDAMTMATLGAPRIEAPEADGGAPPGVK